MSPSASPPLAPTRSPEVATAARGRAVAPRPGKIRRSENRALTHRPLSASPRLSWRPSSPSIVAAVGGTTVGYAALNKSVTLSLDGQAADGQRDGWHRRRRARRPRASRSTDKDLVAPGLDEPIDDGSRISVQFGRPLDAQRRRRGAHLLGQLHRRRHRPGRDRPAASRAPTCRPAAARRIGRSGMPLEVVTPKSLAVKVGDAEAQAQEASPPSPSRDVLAELGVEGRQRRHGHARRSTRRSRDGDKIVVTDIRVVTQARQGRAHRVRHVDPRGRLDATRARSETVRAGRAGVRDVTYELRFATASSSARKVLTSDVSARPSTRSSGSAPRRSRVTRAQLRLRRHRLGLPRAVRVRRQLGHQHRQRLLRRPPVQPGHLAGVRRHRPPEPGHAARRRSPSRPSSATPTGGYGAWPACSAKLGLPQLTAPRRRTSLSRMTTPSAGPRLLGPAEVRSLAARLDLRPTKQRGQNFVIDANTVRRIVRDVGRRRRTTWWSRSAPGSAR